MGARRLALSRSLFLAAGLACVPAAAFAQGRDIDMAGDAPADPPAAGPDAEAPAAPVKDPKAVKTWTQAGDTLMRKGDQLAKQGKAAEAKTNYDNAATAYQKAIDASDESSALHVSLATAYDKAGDAVGAMKALKVVIGAQSAKPDIIKKAQTKLDELSMKIGLVSLTIIPEGTTITIGDKSVGESPLPEPLVLMPGTHVVTLSAVGYQPKDIELKVEAGSESERKIELEPVPVSIQVNPQEPVDAPAPVEPKAPSPLPLYIGGGAAVGLLLLGTVTGIAAIGKQGQYDDSVSATERSDLASSGKSLALVTDLALLGAVGAAAFTTYWYVYKYRPTAKALAERQVMRHPNVDVVPWVQPEVGGIAAVGTF